MYSTGICGCFSLAVLVLNIAVLSNGFPTTSKLVSPPESDPQNIKQTFLDLFQHPRYTEDERNQTGEQILTLFRQFGLKTFKQNFKAISLGVPGYHKGVNIVGIREGKLKREGKKDKILVVAFHYDTVNITNGMDDNASGSTGVIEIARLLSQTNNVDVDHSIYFVCFDLEELGLLGSHHFVNSYLIPKEINENNAEFIGAYVMDMALVYNPINGSQSFPDDMTKKLNESIKVIEENGSKGDFAATWIRDKIEDSLMEKMSIEWNNIRDNSSKYKLYELRANRYDIPIDFDRSDHAAFWDTPEDFFDKLPAMLVTDMGPWRAGMQKCYHKECDNQDWLTHDNLLFLKKIIDSVFRVVVFNPPDVFDNKIIGNSNGDMTGNRVASRNITEWY